MVSTFSMGMDHEHLVAKPALPLWKIEVTLDRTITVTGIIDSGCQVFIIYRNVWEKLSTSMKHEQVMFMESANGQANMTMGTIPSICFSVGEVTLYCSVQVVRNFPFVCLLSPPFTSLASTKCQEFLDGSAHLLFTNPTRRPPLQFPLMLRSPQGPAIYPALMRRIFNCQWIWYFPRRCPSQHFWPIIFTYRIIFL